MGESTGGSTQPYKYNGKELDRANGLDWCDYGARWYDATRIGWTSADSHCEKYYDISPYVYCEDNPVNAIDSDGRDSYLIVWASSQTEYGHSAFAVDNYRYDLQNRKYIPSGTVTVYGLFPYTAYSAKKAILDSRERGLFAIDTNATLQDIKSNNFNSLEGKAPDGIIIIKTDVKVDSKTKSVMQKEIKSNKGYKGRTRNCSTFAREGIMAATGKRVKGEESTFGFDYATPNALFNDTRKTYGAKVILDPGDKTKYEFKNNFGQ